MTESTESAPEATTSQGRPEAFSKCGCLKGELRGGIVTIITVNEACDHKMPETEIPLAAAKDVSQILDLLSR